ncbi:MAG: RluA family pseudouridine synthase [Rickettsiales bacterium]|nr:RluA family pseudouridine synthase [Rickettsiales bacterium]
MFDNIRDSIYHDIHQKSEKNQMIQPIKVSATEDGIRLHRFLSRHYPSANMILTRRLCRGGEIRINSKRCIENDILKSGDLIRVPPGMSAGKIRPQKMKPANFSMSDLEKLRQCIVHDDDDIVVFNKPAGLAVQGGGAIKKSLDKMAAALFPNYTILLVHRLDKETSGLIVVAKNQAAAQKMAAGFQLKDIRKTYIAVLSGGVSPNKGVIDEPIDGKKAITEYKVLGGLKNALTFVCFTPLTGRKHQLRRHAAFALKAPIVGDDLYGSRREDGKLGAILSRTHLHLFASRVTFKHPRTGKDLTINAAMPKWMKLVAELCEIESW